MKLLSLVIANIKGFLRNWKSVLTLIIFPLLLIIVIFFSFNTNGMHPVSGGVVFYDSTFLELQNFNELFVGFMHVSLEPSEDHCVNKLEHGDYYVCMIVHGNEQSTSINIIYDNTKDNIIWSVVERVATTFDFAKSEITRQETTSLVNDLLSKEQGMSYYEQLLGTSKRSLDQHTNDLQVLELDLVSARSDLDSSLDTQEDRLDAIQTNANDLADEKNFLYHEANSNYWAARSDLASYHSFFRNSLNGSDANEADRIFNSLYSELDDSHYRLSEYNSIANTELNQLNQELSSSRNEVYVGRQYSTQLQSIIDRIPAYKDELSSAKNSLTSAQNEFSTLHKEFEEMSNFDIDQLLNPFAVTSHPAYTPPSNRLSVSAGAKPISIHDAQTNLNKLGLQTMFPSVLVLIVMFISLLIATFVTLTDINDKSYSRILLIPKLWFQPFFSLYVSTLIVCMIPTFIILCIGQFVFSINLFAQFHSVVLVLFLLSSTFIFLGIGISYLVRNKGMTMLVTTFMLIFFIFFSGFLLPYEKMSFFARLLTVAYPARLSLDSLREVFFYQVPTQAIFPSVLAMSVVMFGVLCATLLIKYVQEKRIKLA